MPVSSYAVRLLSPVRATALGLGLLAASAALGCAPSGDGGAGGQDGSGEQPGNGTPPNGEGQGPGTPPAQEENDLLGCPGRTIVAASCNYVTTAEKNLAAGFTPIQPNEDFAVTGRKIFDLFQPTEMCKTDLETWFKLDVNWKKDAKARNYALTALHTLFFHPLMVPTDDTFVWKDSPVKIEKNLFTTWGALPIPASHDYVLQRSYMNEYLMSSFRNVVSKIVWNADIVDGSKEVHMETWGGQIDVNAYWLVRPDGLDKSDPTALASWKYVLAGTFFHEMQHAAGKVQHAGCSSEIYGIEKSCNDTLIQSSYGREMQLGQAFFYGAAYTRLANGSQRLTNDATVTKTYEKSCLDSTERVNDVAAWVRDHDSGRTQCTKYSVVQDIIAQRKTPSAAGGPPPATEDAGEVWGCQ